MATAFRDPSYSAEVLGAIYELVAPASIDVMSGGRLIRIGRQHSEYLLFQTMWVLFKSCFGNTARTDRGAVDAAMLLEAYERMPANMVLPERKKRSFISGLLSRNEVDRDYAYNRRLFKRLSTGLYLFEPGLAVRRQGKDGEEWVSVYAALNLGLLREFADPFYMKHLDWLQKMIEGAMRER